MQSRRWPDDPDAARGPATDPRVARSRAVIVETASVHFLEHGYLAANLDEIAHQADVSKRTIYNLYGDKERLFRAILAESLDTAERYAEEVTSGLGDADDVEVALRAAGLRLAQAVFGGRVVPLRRLLIGEVARFPDLAGEYYQRAPQRVMASIAEALARFDERGALRMDDPVIAAEHFAFLVIGASLDRALFASAERAPMTGEVEARARAGVDTFLRAYEASR